MVLLCGFDWLFNSVVLWLFDTRVGTCFGGLVVVVSVFVSGCWLFCGLRCLLVCWLWVGCVLILLVGLVVVVIVG